MLEQIRSATESSSDNQNQSSKSVLNTLKDVIQVNGSIDEFMDQNGAAKEIAEMVQFCRQKVDLHGWDGKLSDLDGN